MTPTLRLVHPPEVAARWTEFRAMLDRAIQHARGELEVDDILASVMVGSMGILAQEKGDMLELVLAFEIIPYPRRSVFNIVAMGGRNFAGFADCYDLIDSLADTMGASIVRCYCRPSMARHVKRMMPDVQQAYVVMEREVHHAGLH